MYFKRPARSQRAWTLAEVMVGMALFSIASIALMSIFAFSSKSFASLANYAILDIENREAMDSLSREIRQARLVKSFVTNSTGNSLTLLNAAGQQVTFSFNKSQKRFIRTVGGSSTEMLTNCNLLDFHLFQRNPSNGNYGVFPVAYGNWTQSVKVVQLSWKTSRQVPAGPINSENIQTARIVIRKQDNGL